MHGDVSNQWCITYYSSKKHYVTTKNFGSNLAVVKWRNWKYKNCYKTDQIWENREIQFKNKFQKKPTYLHNL